MPRPTASGLPFLVRRADSGKYAYWRNIRPELAPFVAGPVDLSWSLTPHVLAGKTVIKISLKTGDLPLARRRWGEVHRQIEALCDQAMACAKASNGPVVASEPHLTSGDRAVIAAQARHDVMAEHDAAWIDTDSVDSMTPLARGLQAALRQRDAGRFPDRIGSPASGLSAFLAQFPAGMTAAEIRAWARDRDAAGVAEMLATGDTLPLDRPMTVQEWAPDPNAPEGYRLVGEAPLPSEMTRRLAENSFQIEDAMERRKVAHAVLTAKQAAHQDIEARMSGKAIETPPRPAPLVADKPAALLPTIREMHDIWAARVRPDQKTKDDILLYVERFICMHGDLRVHQIKRGHCREFRDELLKFPRAMPADVAKKPFKAIIAWAEKHKPTRLSRVTVNAKGIGTLASLMQIAVIEYELPGDPTAKLRLPVDERDVLDRLPFGPAQLTKLAASPAFRNPPKVTKGGCGAAAYWIPLIGLFAGARLEEIGQLPLTDILEVGGIVYFWFRTEEDEDDDEARPRRRKRRGEKKGEGDKSIKTRAGRRRVPVHRILIELGFLKYLAARRDAGDKMLFPQLKAYRGRWTKNFSRYWGRYQDNYITADEAYVFHSFRHSFIGAMRRKGLRKEYMKAIVGHARELNLDLDEVDDVTDDYGDAHPITILDAQIQKIDYPGLKFERIDEFLK
jgi:hypothetical protein